MRLLHLSIRIAFRYRAVIVLSTAKSAFQNIRRRNFKVFRLMGNANSKSRRLRIGNRNLSAALYGSPSVRWKRAARRYSPLHEAIRDFRFAYTENRDVGMDQPPGTPALSDFPQAIASAFEAAFGRSTKDARPTAEHWIGILAELEKSLIQCAEDKLHWYPAEASECPWCLMERVLGTTLFPAFVPSARR